MRRILFIGFIIYQAAGLIALLAHPEIVTDVFYTTLRTLQ